MNQKFKAREIVIVLGRTGQGKSVWTRQYMKPKKRVFAFDPLQDFRAEYLEAEQAIKRYDRGLYEPENKRGEKQSFRVGITNSDDLEILGALAFLASNCWLAVEESGFIFPPGSRAPEWMRDAAFLGRHQQLNLIVTAQRPTSIPVDLRSQASRVVCFHQREQRDTDWLKEYFGETYKEITSLKPLQCLDSHGNDISKYSISWENDDKQPKQN